MVRVPELVNPFASMGTNEFANMLQHPFLDLKAYAAFKHLSTNRPEDTLMLSITL